MQELRTADRSERRALFPQIHVRVLDVNGKPIENATVRVNGAVVSYNKRNRAYSTSELPAGSYSVTAEAPDLETQTRDVAIVDRAVQARFILGKPGLPHYYRGTVKVPYDIPPMVAVALKPEIDSLPADLVNLAKTLDLVPAEIPANAALQHVNIFRAPSGQAEKLMLFEERATRADMFGKFVQRAGQVVRYDADSLSFLTNQCVVKFRPGFDGRAEARRRQLDVVRELPKMENTFVLQGNPPMTSTDVLNICNVWAVDGSAVWAEPNLVSTVVPHSPNDTRLSEQPHHTRIGSNAAWDIVNPPTGARRSNVVIAVADYGCLTSHEDLTAILSPDRFNFSDNTAVLMTHRHGTRASGIAAAVVNNGLGVAGVAGFPAFCKLMAVQIPTLPAGAPDAGTELDFHDMFLWCAGLENGRPAPAQLARGADVISNSWGLDGLSDSGLAAAAFDRLLFEGRGGKGCVVVFSTGNNDTDYTMRYPLAAHPVVIAVGASTITGAEVRVSNSNFGSGIDVCAPAGDGTLPQATLSTSTDPGGNAAGGYELFGQTSAACPQVAGIAALMLAVNPDLTADEVRGILHDTAVQIDTTNPNPDAAYLNGHSLWYGYGRVNAEAAVQAAEDAASVVVNVPAPPTNVRIVT